MEHYIKADHEPANGRYRATLSAKRRTSGKPAHPTPVNSSRDGKEREEKARTEGRPSRTTGDGDRTRARERGAGGATRVGATRAAHDLEGGAGRGPSADHVGRRHKGEADRREAKGNAHASRRGKHQGHEGEKQTGEAGRGRAQRLQRAKETERKTARPKEQVNEGSSERERDARRARMARRRLKGEPDG